MPVANDRRVKAGHFPRDHSKETCGAQKIDCSSPPLTQFQVRPNLRATPAIIFDIAIRKKHSGVGLRTQSRRGNVQLLRNIKSPLALLI
jgi:hypothetical protein